MVDPASQDKHVDSSETRKQLAETALRESEERYRSLAETHEQLKREVRQRRRAEEELRASEERYRMLVETSPDGIFTGDPFGQLTFVSRRILEMYGADDVEELLGRNCLDFIHPDDHPTFLVALGRVLTGGAVRDLECTLRKKDGSGIIGEASAMPLRDGSGVPCGFVAVLRDITQRRRTELALQESEQRIRTISDSALDAVVMIDAEGRVLYWNPAAQRMFGYSPTEMIGQDVHAILPVPRYRASAQRGFSHFALTGEGAAVGKILELTARRRDDTEFPIEMSVSSFRMFGNWCAAAIVRDVTERKRAREALDRQRRTLEHMLRASDYERQLITYDIHDGLAQHLTGAIMQFEGYESLKNTRPKLAASAYRTGMAMLRQGHSEARRLISGLRPPILDDSGIVAAINHLVHDPALPSVPRIAFSCKVSFDRLAPVLESVIYRIVQEALSNALRHSQSDTVRITLLQQAGKVRVEIRDWGIGFDTRCTPENRFGLESIRERTRVLGGKSRIRSRPGQGTSVRVELPLVEAPSR